jgi:hypothetical protein
MQFSWILFVKQTFNDCGFSDLWETEHFNNIEYYFTGIYTIFSTD